MNITMEKVLEKLVTINPVSAVAIMFCIIFLVFSGKFMNALLKIHEKDIREIKSAYSENINAFKELLKNK